MPESDNDNSPFARALKTVESFSDCAVAVLPEMASGELVSYIAKATGEDPQKIARLYDMIINAARLDKYTQEMLSGTTGFAEEEN
jgi:hypothetical protein